MSKDSFMKNYNSLIKKTDGKDLDLVLQFCNYFQSDDLNLFNEYKKHSANGCDSMSIDELIELYGKRYQLSPERDMEQIAKVFINNVIQEGYVFHLNSTANYETIMKNGLGLSAIGRKTEERKDYELLQSTLNEDVFRRLQPYHGDKKGSKVYYSNRPILYARYGQMPEWIMELKTNFSDVEGQLNSNDKELVKGIVNKYDKKYANSSRQLFLLPNPLKEQITPALIDSLLKDTPPKQLITALFVGKLSSIESVDSYYTGYFAPEDMLSVDLNDLSISYNKDGEVVKYSTGDNQNTISV